MRTIRAMLSLGLCLGAAVGCGTTEKNLKPPKPPEEFRAPPEDDPRYTRPVEYPKDTMDQDPLLKKAKDAAKGLPNGGGPRMTGPGGGGGGGRPGGY